MLTIPSLPLLSQDKQMLTKSKDWLTVKSAQEEEKDSIGQNRAEIRLLSLLMISICLKKKNSELSHLSSCWDNGWTMEGGTIFKAKNSNIYVESTLLLLCCLLLEVEMLSLWGISDTLICFMFSPLMFSLSIKSLAMCSNGILLIYLKLYPKLSQIWKII